MKYLAIFFALLSSNAIADSITIPDCNYDICKSVTAYFTIQSSNSHFDSPPASSIPQGSPSLPSGNVGNRPGQIKDNTGAPAGKNGYPPALGPDHTFSESWNTLSVSKGGSLTVDVKIPTGETIQLYTQEWSGQNTAPVPEPEEYAMMLLGLPFICRAAIRRKLQLQAA